MGLMTHEVTLDLPYAKADCFAAAEVALEDLGHKIISKSETLGTMQASAKSSFTSTTFGDVITITVADVDGKCQMTVNSTTKFPTLLAGRQQIKNVQLFSDALEKRLADYGTVAPASASSGSAADEIKKYKELLDIGAITQEEFDQKKKQLLGI